MKAYSIYLGSRCYGEADTLRAAKMIATRDHTHYTEFGSLKPDIYRSDDMMELWDGQRYMRVPTPYTSPVAVWDGQNGRWVNY